MSGRFIHGVVDFLDRAAGFLPRKRRALHLETGTRGEEAVYFHLRRLGYVMVARNWRSPRRRSELDLVGWDGETLCFVEVKTRTSRDVMPAEAAVDEEKRGDLRRVAREYLRRVPGRPSCRFDVASVYYGPDAGPPSITLFKNAFPMA